MAKKRKFLQKYHICLFLPICATILVAIFMFVGSYWIQIANKYQEKSTLATELLSLKEKEEQLKVDVSRLEDPDYVARFAREKYMYSKEGEIILRLPEEN